LIGIKVISAAPSAKHRLWPPELILAESILAGAVLAYLSLKQFCGFLARFAVLLAAPEGGL
jgi:hypothetical protein